eukprot:g8346.t1
MGDTNDDRMQAQVVRALSVIHDPSTPVPQRTAAGKFCENFKDQFGTSIRVGWRLVIQPGTSPQVLAQRHFGLHCLEHVVTRRWYSLAAAEQAQFKKQCMSLMAELAQAVPPPPSLLYGKVAAIVAELAKRDWPQRWPSFVSDLLATQHHSPVAEEMCLLVFRDLAQEIAGFNPHLPSKRRREVRIGLLASLEQILSFAFHAMAKHLSLYKTANPQTSERWQAKQVVHAALQTLAAFLEWTSDPPEALYQSPVIKGLCELLSTADFTLLGADVLTLLLSKKMKDAGVLHQQAQEAVWPVAVRVGLSLHKTWAETCCPSSINQTNLERKRSTLTTLSRLQLKVLQLLHALGKQHLRLLDPASARACRDQLLALLASLLEHPNLQIRTLAVDQWLLIVRHHLQLCPVKRGGTPAPSPRSAAVVKEQPWLGAGHIGKLYQICHQQVRKPEDAGAPKSGGQEGEWDGDDTDAGQQTADFSLFRGKANVLVKVLVEADPQVCLGALHSQLQTCLRGLTQQGAVLPGSLSDTCLEASTSMCDWTLNALYTSDGKLIGTLPPNAAPLILSIVRMWLELPCSDARIEFFRLKFCKDLGPVLALNRKIVPFVLEALLKGVCFLSPQERQTAPEDISDASKTTRRRACYSLLHIARTPDPILLPVFGHLCQRVIELERKQALSRAEVVSLYKFLVCVSNALPKQGRQQREFLEKLLQKPLREWNHASLTGLLKEPTAFLSVIGLNKEEIPLLRSTSPRTQSQAQAACMARHTRSQLLHNLEVFNSVFEALDLPNDQDIQTEQDKILASIAPTTLHLARAILSIRLPALQRQIRSVCPLLLAPTREHLWLEVGKDSGRAWLSREVQGWLQATLDIALHALSLIAARTSYLYTHDRPMLLLASLFPPELRDALHDYQVKLILDRFFCPYLAKPSLTPMDAEPGAWIDHVLPPLAHILRARLTQSWQQFAQRNNAQSPPPELKETTSKATVKKNLSFEILEEQHLRALTRAVCDTLRTISIAPSPPQNHNGERRASGSSSSSSSYSYSYSAAAAVAAAPASSSFVASVSLPSSPTHSAGSSSASSASSSQLELSPIGKLLVTRTVLALPVLNLLTLMLSFPDHVTTTKVMQLLGKLAPLRIEFLKQAGKVGQEDLACVEKLLIGCLSCLAKCTVVSNNAFEAVAGSTVLVVKEVYLEMLKAGAPLQTLARQTFLKLPKVSTTELANFEAQVAQCAKDKEQRKAFRAFLQTYVVGLQSTSNFEPGAHILNLPETLKLDPAVSLGGFSDSSLTYKQVTRATRKAQEHSEPAGLEEDGAALIRLFNSE